MSRQRLGTASAELYYEEYIQRRNKELAARTNRPPSKKTTRSVSSNDRRPSSKSSVRSKGSRPGSTTTGRGSLDAVSKEDDKPKPYEMEGHQYKPSGYQTFDTQLGEDPVTAIKILKTRLRNLSVASTAKDKTVKAQLCQQACERLSEAESHMNALVGKRSSAMMHGDSAAVKQISGEMQQLRQEATFHAYSDLLLDDHQITPFGVKSKWAPDPEQELEENEPKPKPKKPPKESRFIRTMSERKKDREKVERKEEKKPFRPLSPQKPTKRNERLFGTVMASDGQVRTANDPFAPPDAYGECPYCDEKGPDLGRDQLLKLHMSENCPCLTRCDFCDKVIDVALLNEHQLDRCPFVSDNAKACELCGLACYKGDSNHPRCRKMMPPENASWCPLCSIAVRPKDSKEAWQQHLKKDCYNNPRKHLSGVPAPAYFQEPEPSEPAPPNTAPSSDAPGANGNTDAVPYDPNNPNNQYPPQYVYAQTGVSAESIREAFERIKNERKEETDRMRAAEAAREKMEEEAAEKEAARLEKEVAKIKKKREDEKKKK